MIGAKYQGFEWKPVKKIIISYCHKQAGEYRDKDKLHGQLYAQKEQKTINCQLLKPWQNDVYGVLSNKQNNASYDNTHLEMSMDLYAESMLDNEIKNLCDKNLSPYYSKKFRTLSAEQFAAREYNAAFKKSLSDYFSGLRHRVDAGNMSQHWGETISDQKVLVLSKVEELLKLLVREFDNWSALTAEQSLIPDLLNKDIPYLLHYGLDTSLLDDPEKKSELIMRMDVLQAELKDQKPCLPEKKYNNLVNPKTMAKKYLPYLEKYSFVVLDSDSENYLINQDADDFLDLLEEISADPVSNVVDIFSPPRKRDNNDNTTEIAAIDHCLSHYSDTEVQALLKLLELEDDAPGWKQLIQQADKETPLHNNKKWTVHLYKKHIQVLQNELAQCVES